MASGIGRETVSCRAAVFELLTTDSVLQDLWGIDEETVFANAELDVAPRDRHFLVLRWGEETVAFGDVGSEILTIWAHVPRQMSTDYVSLLAILYRVRDLLRNATHVVGADGILTTAKYNGLSPDFNDETLKTLSKNVAFTVVSKPATVE
jgi:hypothetical protein